MAKRLFIAINLPADLKKRILNRQQKWPKFGLNLTRAENLHVTLAFIGDVEDNDVDKVIKVTEEAAKGLKPFEISLEQIHLGPNANLARMIWLSGPADKNLIDLASKLTENLKRNGFPVDSNHGFKLHVTLTRARGDELRGAKIEEKLDYSFTAGSVEVMESELSNRGAGYRILKSIRL